MNGSEVFDKIIKENGKDGISMEKFLEQERKNQKKEEKGADPEKQPYYMVVVISEDGNTIFTLVEGKDATREHLAKAEEEQPNGHIFIIKSEHKMEPVPFETKRVFIL